LSLSWERDVPGEATEQAAWIEEVPYGLRVADDCIHLEENPVERLTMQLMLKLISGDKSMSQIAEELNRQGSRTRRGTAWTQTAVFNMLPRLIEAAPYIWRSESGEQVRATKNCEFCGERPPRSLRSRLPLTRGRLNPAFRKSYSPP
jgi:Recombinase